MARDEETFTALFDAHRRPVFAFLLGRLSDGEVARDLLQESFLRAWQRLDEVGALDGDRQLAWLVTVARNLVIDRYRAEATRDATQATLRRETPPPPPGPEEHAEWRERLDVVDEAIRRLPGEQRTILAMATVAGMSSSEIGAALGQPAGTIRYKLHRARQRLAADLDVEV